MAETRLIQFQCGKEGTMFYYQTGVNNPFFVSRCPICGSTRISEAGRTFRAVDENKALPKAAAHANS